MPPAAVSESASTAGRSASRHVGICVLRALFAAGAAVLLAAGIGLLIWAVTPQSGSPGNVVRGAVAGLGAANFLPPSIGGIPVTIAPLLLTAVCFGLVASAANRGSRPGVGPAAEWVGAVVVGLVYGAVVTAVVVALAPSGAEGNAGRGWAPVLLGVIAAVAGMTLRGRTWRSQWRARAPDWLRVGTQAGGAAMLLMLAGGAVAVAAGLVLSFGTAIDLSTMAAPAVGDSVGMVLLSLAFLPNAVLAGVGYTLGIGFQFGAGTYSPLGTTAVELPAIPLLAAVPDAGGMSPIGLILVIFPVCAALLIGWRAVRLLSFRRERLAAAVLGSLWGALGVTVAAAVAGGGVTGSGWAHLWIPALGVGGVALAVLAVLSSTMALVAGWGSVPWAEVPAGAGHGDDGEGAVGEVGDGKTDDGDDGEGADGDDGDGEADDEGDHEDYREVSDDRNGEDEGVGNDPEIGQVGAGGGGDADFDVRNWRPDRLERAGTPAKGNLDTSSGHESPEPADAADEWALEHSGVSPCPGVTSEPGGEEASPDGHGAGSGAHKPDRVTTTDSTAAGAFGHPIWSADDTAPGAASPDPGDAPAADPAAADSADSADPAAADSAYDATSDPADGNPRHAH